MRCRIIEYACCFQIRSSIDHIHKLPWHTMARHFSGKNIDTSKDEIRAKLKPTGMTITKNVMTAALANEPAKKS